MYILLCSNGKYYTGSTIHLHARMMQHFNGLGSNFTRKYPPVELIYYEKYPTIWEAFRREKQVQGWSKNKKEALIESRFNDLPFLSKKLFKKK